MMNIGMDHRAIFDIACLLKPTYNVQQARYMDFLQEPDNLNKLTVWEESVDAYHNLLIKNAGALGKAMKLPSAYVKMFMGVRDYVIIWTPDMLRNVANYERVNPNYWVHSGAVKLNHYEFPQEIAA